MPSVDLQSIAIFGAVILGLLLVFAGLYIQRGGRLRTRQGAAILASFRAFLGVVVVAGAAVAIMFGEQR